AYAIAAMEAGAHVFVEKPLAETIEDAGRVIETARRTGRKLVIGYILRQHPSWQKFAELARTLGKPLVMRMNLNQQSRGAAWATHLALMQSMPPIVDCGVHYVDVMCQMTGARPVRVSAIGARLSAELPPGMYNYGCLQVAFADGSVGWYEAGWGPMMSEVAHFVKDVVGPRGCVSIVARGGERASGSADVAAHTRTEALRVHYAERRPDGEFARADEWIDTADEPDHDELCVREQQFLLRAIREGLDLDEHQQAAIDSLRVVLAADRAAREGRSIDL
ncbi:MAG TPA: Gfo/Idh/MocA family oxidoreductase, partial [Planctomycetota bacterium]|nr:Gfo/Idh/MocA family oxidoreductase [Planctomycetota bacterium]